jgi:hypothetical protein
LGLDLASQVEQLVNRVLTAVEGVMPSAPVDSGAEILALAAIRRLADLVASECALVVVGRLSTSRVIGRSSIEAWLWVNYLLLEPEAAVDRLLAEDAGQQWRLEHGRIHIWDQLESKRPGGIDLRMHIAKSDDARPPKVEQLAGLVANARATRGFGYGKPLVDYQLTYRRDSIEDVHFGLAVAGRYFADNGLLPLPQPEAGRDASAFRGPQAIRESAALLSDALGVYLTVKGRTDEFERLKTEMSTPLGP